MHETSSEPRERWQSADAGRRYAEERWTSTRKRERDGAIVARILDDFLPARPALLLDVPCGAGRLRPVLRARGRTVGLDVSLSMLASARAADDAELVRGDAQRLPFRDETFDAVVCCRLLHHLRERSTLERILAELLRVSRDLVVASFWDAACLPEWKRGWLPGRASRRCARSRAEMESALAAAGAEIVGYRHSLRFVSRQAFLIARRRPGTRERARP